MLRTARLAWVFAIVFIVGVTSALAAPVPSLIAGPIQRATMNPILPVAQRVLPVPNGTLTPAPAGAYVGAVPDGTRVPLSQLPRLPLKSLANSVSPKSAHMRRPMSADGQYIDITGTNCGGQGALGDQFNVGCSLNWQAWNLVNGHTKQDYVISNVTGNELTAGGAVATGATYTGTSGNAHNTALATAGTYIFGVYDQTAGGWAAVIYVNAGQVFSIKVYQDPFHTQETYQFASSDTAAYVYLQNVAASDYYVVGVHQTGVSPNCVFMGPAPLPSPYAYPANQLCNLTASTGVQAPGGNLSVTWPLNNAALKAGSYSVEVFDLTQGVRLGQIQVSLTAATGLVLTTYPDNSGGNADPSPNPKAAATPSTIMAWDGTVVRDESTTGIKTTVTGVGPDGANYLWTLIDPQGQLAGAATGTVAGGTASNTFTFDALLCVLANCSGTLNPPGQYPAKTFVTQLYNTTNKQVIASQSFQILGYSSLTQFNNGGLATSISIAPGAKTVAGLQITNTSNQTFNGAGDNFTKVIFSTGPNFANTVTGNGIMVSTVNGALAPCNTSCAATTTTDSNGNTWNVQATCSAGGLNTKGECTIEFDASSPTIYLPPGAYISMNNISFFYTTGGSCGNTCQGLTSEMPQHGLQWSTTSSTIAWSPVYFSDAASTQSGTAAFRLIGNANVKEAKGAEPAYSTYTAPFVGNHYFQSNFLQSDLNLQSPYTETVSATPGSYTDVWAVTVKNTSLSAGNITDVAIEYPSLLLYQGFFQLDGYAAGWTMSTFGGTNGCPANFSAEFACVHYNAGIAPNASQTVYIDETFPLQSFPFQELVVEAYANGQWFAIKPFAGANTLPDGSSVDNLAVGAFSLIGSDMTANFNPNTVGAGATANLGFQFKNVSQSLDPNPDSVDLVVLEAPSTGLNVVAAPPAVGNWSYLGSFKLNGATTTQYWFGTCASQFTAGAQQGAANYGGPPLANSSPVGEPLTATYKSIGTCAADTSALKQGQSVSFSNWQLSNFAAGTETWKVYAHGANTGAWSSPQNMTLTVSTESASIGFNQINGTAIATNSIPTIGGSPNTYQYAITNTSKSSNIGTVVLTIPGLDINNQNAFDGTTQWTVHNITTGGVTLSNPAGQTDGTGGCVVDTTPANTFNPTNGGANGQITIKGCTTFKPGDTLYVNFTADNPLSQSDSYLFPATVDGNPGGAAWLGANQVTEQFSLGLNIVVNPSNPGPGGSTPVVNCQIACGFAGSTIDFGNPAANSTNTYQDVIRASIVYTGATSPGHNLQLWVVASSNPTNSTGVPTNELLTDADSAHSTSGGGITFNTTSYTVVPTAGLGVLVATAPETNRATPYDIINNFELAVGAEALTAHTVTVTYTLVPI
ncbi:MAG: hypothetical protein JO322_04490 [Candidatus Eremiobacteraeota bacterium]|nr:hypothetical protein [Candidatus Eremiobacteraeota bacterium]